MKLWQAKYIIRKDSAQVLESLESGREDTRDVVVGSTIEAKACGGLLWRKSLSQKLTI